MTDLSLTALASRLEQLATEVQENRLREHEGARATRQCELVEESVARLDAAAAFLRLVRSGLIPNAAMEYVHQAVLNEATAELEAVELMAADAPVRALLGPEIAELREKLSGLSALLELIARTAWSDHWEQIMPPLQKVLLEALQPGLPAAKRGLVDKILTRDQILLARRGEPPATADDYEKFLALVDERNTWFAEIEVSDDPEIQEFLIRSASEGIPLAEISDNIRAWLDENNLTSDYVVVPRNMEDRT